MRALFVLLKVVFKIVRIFFIFEIAMRLLKKVFRFPAPPYIDKFLDSDIRKLMQSPSLVVKRSGLKLGMNVLEIGCGSGAFTLDIARAISDSGSVTAVDIEQEMLAKLEEKINSQSLAGYAPITLLQHNAYSIPVDAGTYDAVCMISSLQEIPSRQKSLKEVYRILKKGGILAITEFLPDPDYPLQITTVKEGLKAGFTLDIIEGNFWNYTVRFIKK